MGFGLICAGLTTLLFLRLIPCELIGFIAVSRGLTRLRNYNSYFKWSLYCTYALIGFSAVDAIFWVLKLSGIADGMTFTEGLLSYTHMLLLLPFQLILARALMTISSSLGFDKGVKRAVLSSSTAVVYYLFYALSCVNTPITGYLKIATVVLFLMNFAFLELAVHVCYRAITTDEAEAKEEEKIAKFEKQFGKGKTVNSKAKSNKKEKTTENKKG